MTSWINHSRPALVLAPMEGVTDAPMRALMSERGGFSYCVSEFLRVSQEVPPAKVFHEHIPELSHGCKTPAGTPVQIQILGGHPERMALTALRAVELGAQAVDINFGCPAPTVNRHDGGAAILKYPDRITEIVAAVRARVPSHIPVSAKLRLGWESAEDIYVNAKKAEDGGASWIAIHARTKTQGYTPPAYWKHIGIVRKQLSIPVIANGDIWTREDFLRCREETGCIHYMLGRGALADPMLPLIVASELGILDQVMPEDGLLPMSLESQAWTPLVERFADLSRPFSSGQEYTTRRIKQWVKMASLRRPIPWFDQLKLSQNLEQVYEVLNRSPQ